jgi:Clr5 domain
MAEQHYPDEEQWELFKEYIRSIYVDDNLKLEGSGGVIELMAERHSFRAT